MGITDVLIQLIGLTVLLLMSAFFSGSETAFFSLNGLEKDLLRHRSGGQTAKFVHLLFTQPDEVLVTVLTGNMFVNIFASSISEAIGAELFRESAELVSIGSMTLLLLVIGEMTPKNLAIRHSLKFAQFSASTLRFLHTGLRPISYPLGRIRGAVLGAFPKRGRDATADQSTAVLSAIRMGYQSKTIDESELRLLERFFRFRQKTAADVMTPRVDLKPVDAGLLITDYLAEIRSSSDAKPGRLIPIYKNDVDHISGYVRRVELVRHRFSPAGNRMIDVSKPIHAVPASKRLRELMEEMSGLGTEMAVVVDEYGGIEGIVSYPGLVEYLFEDFLPAHHRAIEEVDTGGFRISGSADVDEVAAALNIEIESQHRTLGGLIIDELGEFPVAGAGIDLAGFRFTVSDVENYRIAWIAAERLPL